MSSTSQPPTGNILRALLAEKGIRRYELFLTQQEGKQLPGGVEAISGFVLAEGGEVYGFWLDWDAGRGAYSLNPWYRVEEPSQFEGDAEYRRARQRLEGLDIGGQT